MSENRETVKWCESCAAAERDMRDLEDSLRATRERLASACVELNALRHAMHERNEARAEATNHSELLEAAEDLLNTLHIWKLDISGPLLTRDADSGKIVGGWAGDQLQEEVSRARSMRAERMTAHDIDR